jgi:hypothetical protein
MPTINISRAYVTRGDGTETILFDPFIDSLKLVVDFDLSSDIVQLPNVFLNVVFELIDFRTNIVVVHHPAQYSYNPTLGRFLFAWAGSPTPQQWGLQWIGNDIFGFRVGIEASSYQSPNGFVAIEALAVSDIKWFRLEDVFMP